MQASNPVRLWVHGVRDQNSQNVEITKVVVCTMSLLIKLPKLCQMYFFSFNQYTKDSYIILLLCGINTPHCLVNIAFLSSLHSILIPFFHTLYLNSLLYEFIQEQLYIKLDTYQFRSIKQNFSIFK